jgi:hypothetical protein
MLRGWSVERQEIIFVVIHHKLALHNVHRIFRIKKYDDFIRLVAQNVGQKFLKRLHFVWELEDAVDRQILEAILHVFIEFFEVSSVVLNEIFIGIIFFIIRGFCLGALFI